MILFLDIDGVLHPDPATAEQAFCRRHLLWDLLLVQTQIRVVISSDWRLRHSLPEMTELILAAGPSALAPRIIGVTPECPDARHVYEGRQRECLQWLADHAPAHPWLALDDVAANFSYGSPHLVLIDHRTGLTPSDLKRVLARVPAEYAGS